MSYISAPPKIIDLFAGCGGMSLGFRMAGYDAVFATEIDEWASQTYTANHPGAKVVTDDIRRLLDPFGLVSEVLRGDELAGVVGGPPCQGFSMSGTRDSKDPRNSLFADFMRFVGALKPRFFVMENVPGIRSLKLRSGALAEKVVIAEAEARGYNVEVLQLNAANYGVPQARTRVFFVGVRSDIPFAPDRLVPPVTHRAGAQVSTWQAISDLPLLNAGEKGDGAPYRSEPESAYQEWAREGSNGVRNHEAMRHTPRLIERFKLIRVGESVDHVPAEHGQRKRGSPDMLSGKSFGQNNMRVDPHRPSPTVAASFQSNFIHPFLHRNFTAREGARLQSFPDWFVFHGRRTTMSWEANLSQYQQIGNAVPPLLARALANQISSYLASPPSREQAAQCVPGGLFATHDS